jgi:peptide/nickel transport system substrate-binding protein
MSHRGTGYLWKSGLPYPEWDALFAARKQAPDIEARRQISYQIKTLHNQQRTAVPLYYPATNYAFRSSAYDQWAESRGFGIVHKWSFLPAAAREGAVVVR